MVNAMSLDDPFHIGGARYVAMRDPSMNDDIVKAEIDGAIGCDARSHPSCPGAPTELHAAKQQDNGWNSEDQCVQVVEPKSPCLSR